MARPVRKGDFDLTLKQGTTNASGNLEPWIRVLLKGGVPRLLTPPRWKVSSTVFSLASWRWRCAAARTSWTACSPLAAWLRFTPRQMRTGGKPRLLLRADWDGRIVDATVIYVSNATEGPGDKATCRHFDMSLARSYES
jgi:hypothetical protein